jgi:hypothetical protein
MICMIPSWMSNFKLSYSNTWNNYTRSRARHALKLIRLINKYKIKTVDNDDPMNMSARVMVKYFHKRNYVVLIKRSDDRMSLIYQIIRVVHVDEIDS